jgi:hypothetical protein
VTFARWVLVLQPLAGDASEPCRDFKRIPYQERSHVLVDDFGNRKSCRVGGIRFSSAAPPVDTSIPRGRCAPYASIAASLSLWESGFVFERTVVFGYDDTVMSSSFTDEMGRFLVVPPGRALVPTRSPCCTFARRGISRHPKTCLWGIHSGQGGRTRQRGRPWAVVAVQRARDLHRPYDTLGGVTKDAQRRRIESVPVGTTPHQQARTHADGLAR